jgi:hypothetical protein
VQVRYVCFIFVVVWHSKFHSSSAGTRTNLLWLK